MNKTPHWSASPQCISELTHVAPDRLDRSASPQCGGARADAAQNTLAAMKVWVAELEAEQDKEKENTLDVTSATVNSVADAVKCCVLGGFGLHRANVARTQGCAAERQAPDGNQLGGEGVACHGVAVTPECRS